MWSVITAITTTTNTKKSPHNILNKFTILYWAEFITSLSRKLPVNCRLDIR